MAARCINSAGYDPQAERRMIGHAHGEKVLVVAPSNAEARNWAREHGLLGTDVIAVTPMNYVNVLTGKKGTPHVIVAWYAWPDHLREDLKDALCVVESVPWEAPDELSSPDDFRF